VLGQWLYLILRTLAHESRYRAQCSGDVLPSNNFAVAMRLTESDSLRTKDAGGVPGIIALDVCRHYHIPALHDARTGTQSPEKSVNGSFASGTCIRICRTHSLKLLASALTQDRQSTPRVSKHVFRRSRCQNETQT